MQCNASVSFLQKMDVRFVTSGYADEMWLFNGDSSENNMAPAAKLKTDPNLTWVEFQKRDDGRELIYAIHEVDNCEGTTEGCVSVWELK